MLSPNLPYIKYPQPQDAEITFQNSITCPISSVVDNRFATTSYVNSFWTALRTATNTWSGKQTFDELLSSQNIGSPITTFTVGTETNDNIHIYTHSNRTAALNLANGAGPSTGIRIGIGTNATNDINILNGNGSTGIIELGSGTNINSLNTPLTPTYTIPVPFSLTDGTYTYGSSGKIGYTIVRANSGGYISGSPADSLFYREISNVSLTQGLWLLSGETQSVGINGLQTGIGFNTTTNTNVGGIGFRGLVRVEYPPPTDPPAQLSTSAVYYASGAVTMRLMMGCSGYGLTPGKSYLTAVRIA